MQKSVELLSPVGDFDCLKAAVQNGADSVYFGGSLFNARASASNFDNLNLKKAINYAKIRNVKTHLTLNTLLKDDEFPQAVDLACRAYEYGIDAIIVQDLGLARYLHKNLPDLPLHASTQMTIHRLEGVQELEKLGFQRVVLARELSVEEIEYICKNTNLEVEVFIHGALCVSYSGQCLFSSSVGARSGNRGKCAQSCRMPYTLIEKSPETGKETMLDSGYLLSPRDLCGLPYLSSLIQAGVTCFKIEGRMKTPEYVATVTRIYRKYIDLALAGHPVCVSEQDQQDLLQVFNRGGFSTGHLNPDSNQNFVFPQKPSNMGIYLGNVSNFQPQKGLVSLNLNDSLAIGDTISFEKEESKYTVSELMLQNQNIPQAKPKEKVTIGRMKGNIGIGDKVFKMASKELSNRALSSYENKEARKIPLACEVFIQKDQLIRFSVQALNSEEGFYKKLALSVTSDDKPVEAIRVPLTEERVKQQIIKTTNTPFEFVSIQIHLDPGLYLPKIGILNELRRTALSNLEAQVCAHNQRTAPKLKLPSYSKKASKKEDLHISALLQLLDETSDYSRLEGIDSYYIPLKYYVNKKYENILHTLSQKGSLYVYLPTIVKSNYRNLILSQLETILKTYTIKGFVISNLSNFECLKDYAKDYEFISNYTFNVFNQTTISELKDCGIKKVTISPELTKENLNHLTDYAPLPIEVIAYGNLPLMNMNYCPFGKTNRCYPTCPMKCQENKLYYLEDRMHFRFPVLPDHLQTVTTIFNSKTTFFPSTSLHTKQLRMDFLNENIDEINEMVSTMRKGKRKTGDAYTSGNFTRDV